MVWWPMTRLELEKLAVPAESTATGEPTFVPSTWNCTDPVPTAAMVSVVVTLAVKLIFWPNTGEPTEAVIPVAVACLLTVSVPLT